MRERIFVIVLIMFAALLPTSMAFAKAVTIAIPMQSIAARSGERGSYYVFALEIPAELAGKRLDRVFLEFVVDVDKTSTEDDPMSYEVGVFPLTSRFTSNLAYRAEGASVRAVPTGADQKIMTDITELVKTWLAGSATNYGLVIGALTGPNVGRIGLNADALAPGAAVRVTFFYQNRFGGRVPTN